MKSVISIITVGSALLALSSCSPKNTISVTNTPDRVITTTPTLPAKTPPTLVGQWSVTEVGGEKVIATNDDYPTVSFDNTDLPEGVVNIYANNGCNYINGSYTVKGTYLVRNGELAATMKFCPDAKYEIAITEAINKMGSYSIEQINNEYYLTLKTVDGTSLMMLRKPNLSFFDGAWRVTNIQGVDISEKKAPELVIDLAGGKVHGNAGCNVLNGSIVQNLDREGGIGFTNLFTTRMSCPDLAIEQAFLVALEQVESCVPGTNTNIALLRDGAGQTIISLQRINLQQE